MKIIQIFKQHSMRTMFHLSLVLGGYSLPEKCEAVLVSSIWCTPSSMHETHHIDTCLINLDVHFKCIARHIVCQRMCHALGTMDVTCWYVSCMLDVAYTSLQWECHKHSSKNLIIKQFLYVIYPLSSMLGIT